MDLKLNLRRQQRSNQNIHVGSSRFVNCFARLDPSSLRCLYHQALRLHTQHPANHSATTNSTNKTGDGSGKRWHITHEKEDNVVFLPLAMTISNSAILFVSYNGGISNQEETIEICEEMIQDKDVVDNSKSTIVHVKALPSVTHADAVYLEPLTTNDWELIEIFAQELESGLLLSQVSIVYPRQIVPLAIGTDLVYLRVLEQGFAMRDGAVIDECLRLVAESQVIISPKPRKQTMSKKDGSVSSTTPTNSPSKPIRIQPTEADYSSDMKNLFHQFNLHNGTSSLMIPCPPLFHAWMHTDTLWHELDGWNEVKGVSNSSAYIFIKKSNSPFRSIATNQNSIDQVAIAKISPSDSIPLDCVALHPNLCLQVDVAPMMDFVQLQILTASQIKDRMTFIDDSLSLKLCPLSICDDMQYLAQTKSSWRYPEDFSFSAAPNYTSQTNQYECDQRERTAHLNQKRTPKSPIQNMLKCDENSLFSHNSIIPFTNDDESEFLCKVQLSRTEGQGKTCRAVASLNECLVLAKELSSLYADRSIDSVIEKNDTDSRHDRLEVPNSYMLNILPSSLAPVTSVLEAVEIATLKSFDKHVTVVTGGVGCGKTYLSLIIAAKARMLFHRMTSYLDCRQLQSSILRMEEMLQELTDVFKQAANSSPSLIILDNVDYLVPNIESNTEDEGLKQRTSPDLSNQVKLLSDHIGFLIEGTQKSSLSNHNDVVVLMTCQDLNALHHSFRYPSSSQVQLPTLTISERVDLFHKMLCEKIGKNEIEFPEYDQVTRATEGYNPYDLKFVTSHIAAKQRHKGSSSNQHLQNFVQEIICNYIPLCRQSLQTNHSEPEVKWCEVGGLFQAKSHLAATILQPIKYKLIYENLPVAMPKGILLFGPPGTGKTIIVPALAQECHFNIITCRGPELFDKYIGASEAKVRNIFERAYAMAPSILFLDEFDSLAPRRGSDNTGVTDRVVNQLLTFLDGVEVHADKDVYIIAASSRPDKIDPALLRPGRLEKHVYIGFAEDKEEWCDLFTKIASKKDMNNTLRESIIDGSFFNSLFNLGVSYLHFSAADIKGIFDTAHLKAIHDFLDTKEEAHDTSLMSNKHLLDAFSSSKPSLPHLDRMLLSKAYLPFLGRDVGEEGCKRSLGLNSGDNLNLNGGGQLKTALK